MDISNNCSSEKCLIIILGQTRAHEKTFQNIKYNLIDRLKADVCICIGEEKSAPPSPFHNIAKYNFTITEPDDWGKNFDYMYEQIVSKYPNKTNIRPWRDLFKIHNQWLGGIPDEHQQPGSAGILIFFRWFLMERIKEHKLTKLYDRFIITRSDYIYTLPHPSLEYLDKEYIWIPHGEQYGGYTDRHVVISNKDIFSYLNIFETIILDNNLQDIMKTNQGWNLEAIIELNFLYHNVIDRIKSFPYIMYTIKIRKEDSSWNKTTGHLHNGVYIKYISEFESAVYYLNEYLTKYPLIKDKQNKDDYCKYNHYTNTIIPYDVDKFYHVQDVLEINWENLWNNFTKYKLLIYNPDIYFFTVKDIRIRYYLGNLYNINFITYFNKDEPWIKVEDVKNEGLKHLLENYKDRKLQYSSDNIEEAVFNYSFVKNRLLLDDNFNSVILYTLQDYNIEQFKTVIDVEFEDKLDKLYWRGNTTGQPDRTSNRFTLVEKYFISESDIDIGFSSIIQGKEAYNKYIKNYDGWHDFLHYKYVISVHGNNADIDLSWKLASHSVVLMAKPQYSTWLMEDFLIPDYHYVLLKDDFSDLREKLDWCKTNQEKCKKIIKNAHQYMEIFKDINMERDIEQEVIRLYFEKHKYIEDLELYDLNIDIYRINNKDLNHYSNTELINHYKEYGINENNRIYNIKTFCENYNFNIDIYKSYNSDLNNLSTLELIKHYTKHGINENRIYNYTTAAEYHNFDANIYRFYNFDIKNLSYIQLIEHYINHGLYEDRIYNINSLVTKYKLNTKYIEEYKKFIINKNYDEIKLYLKNLITI